MKVLILEDDDNRIRWFKDYFKKASLRNSVFVFKEVSKAKDFLKKNSPDLILLDHDLDGRVFVNSYEKNTGYQLAKSMANSGKKFKKVIIHSMNPFGANKMYDMLKDSKNVENIYKLPYPTLRRQQNILELCQNGNGADC